MERENENERHHKSVQQIQHPLHEEQPLVLVAEQHNEGLKAYCGGCGKLLSAPYFTSANSVIYWSILGASGLKSVFAPELNQVFLIPHCVMGWSELAYRGWGRILYICSAYLILLSVSVKDIDSRLNLTVFVISCASAINNFAAFYFNNITMVEAPTSSTIVKLAQHIAGWPALVCFR
ncbi:hypothetical protein Goshw_022719, partial [Gossypium schwendimanii]|nr:hypothetical protein [Gossypium schwendimanii]